MIGRILFVLMLGLHVVYSLYAGKNPETLKTRKNRQFHVLAQGPVLWLGVYLAAQQGVFSRELVSPVFIGIGLVAGHVLFGVSLLVTHQSAGDAAVHMAGVGNIWNFAMRSPLVLTRYLGSAAAEEIIYRAAAQTVLIAFMARFLPGTFWPVAAGIAAAAAVFVAVHREFFVNTRAQGFEFVCFAILLGLLYHLTGSFILVTVIHAIRNIEIAYLEYVAKVDELGDEELAARELEQTYVYRHSGES
ncbi:MAG: hypothetical protein GY851_03840 [bacterium]|nr:hypothetical protein [bacterium]